MSELDPAEIEALRAFMQKAWLEDQAKRRSWGETGPIPSSMVGPMRVVAVHNRLLSLPGEATYHDFLGLYIKRVMGEDWWATESAKPMDKWHEVVRWQQKVHEFQLAYQTSEDGLRSAQGRGVVGHYYQLAFDLHTIEHQGLLQGKLIKRLKIPRQFQGARHEITVSAAFVRAGFDVTFQEEGKGPEKQCDFVVNHRSSGHCYSVEAKSRHIAGVLGTPANVNRTLRTEPNIRGAITDALQKVAGHPRVICVDVNYPQPARTDPTTTWLPVVRMQVQQLEKEGCGPAILLLTNSPLHYLRDDEIARDNTAAVMALGDPNFRPEDQKSVHESYPGLIRAASAFAARIPQNWA